MFKCNVSTVPNTKQATEAEIVKRWTDNWEGPLCAWPGDKNNANVCLAFRKLQKEKPATPATPTPEVKAPV